MAGFEEKPKEVQEAIRSDDREKLSALGRAGARTRARNLAEQKAFVEDSATAFYEDVFTDTFRDLVKEWMRENEITDAHGTPIDEEDLPEYIPGDVVEQFTTDADKTASAMVEMKRRMSARR
jgi:hypothetical protein